VLPYGHFSEVHKQTSSPHSSQTSPVNLYYTVLLFALTGSTFLFPSPLCMATATQCRSVSQHEASSKLHRLNSWHQGEAQEGCANVTARSGRGVTPELDPLWRGYLEHGVVALVGLQGPAIWI